MTTLILILTALCMAVPVYVYAGYPILLFFLTRIIKTMKVKKGSIEPEVALLVSCYNEVQVIRSKILNCLAIDYPREKLAIIFISDGSDDGTDEIVKEYADEGVKLIRQEGRLGKTSALNIAVPASRGEIIVFSDANAMYQEDAIRKLVRNFNDPTVGYVVGAALYSDSDESSAASSENTYWKYEIFIKTMESNLHSVVGGDGAIYAIRSNLYKILDARDINDFVNPLQIIASGYRGVFEKEAVCYERTAGSFEKEGARKERIVNRSIRGLMQVKQVMNPAKAGIFSLMIISHKLLRWLIPFFMTFGILGALYLSAQKIVIFHLIVSGILVFLFLAFLGYFFSINNRQASLFSIPYYFIMVNIYSFRGVCRFIVGETQVTWSNSRSDNDQERRASNIITISVSVATLCFFSLRLFLDLST